MTPTFTTIANFMFSSEAKIVQGRLEADGIQTFLRDAVTIDTDPLVSNAIGGVKLEVLTTDLEKAQEILASISEHSLTDEGAPIECPKCGSNQIQFFSHVTNFKTLAAFIFGFFFAEFPFYIKYDYTCEVCKTKFSDV